jgi:hypothetical protein
MSPSDSKTRDEQIEAIAQEATTPEIRSMYPSRSRGQMKNEFIHFMKVGYELAESEVTKLRAQLAVAIEGLKDIEEFGYKTQSQCACDGLAIRWLKKIAAMDGK